MRLGAYILLVDGVKGEAYEMLHDTLREKALANFDLLLEYWKVNYKKITENEYDILATWRNDVNFGSCRFNIEKGVGADFAGTYLTEKDYKLIGTGFTKDDFSGFSQEGQAKQAFDIIGLCQRIYNCNEYNSAVKYLRTDLKELELNGGIINVTEEQAKAREAQRKLKEAKKVDYAKDLWESAKYHTLEGSVGEKYLHSRGLHVREPTIRFHLSIQHAPTKKTYPALLFKVQEHPEGELKAIHRIYLSEEGTKAPIETPKMVLAKVKGCCIWFGKPNSILYITEGPENALTLREMNRPFVACAIYASNLPHIQIPPYVKEVIICPDPDIAGQQFSEKLYTNLEGLIKIGLKVKFFILPSIKKSNGKFADLNDHITGNLS